MTHYSRWVASSGLQKARSRAEEVPDAMLRCTVAPKFKMDKTELSTCIGHYSSPFFRKDWSSNNIHERCQGNYRVGGGKWVKSAVAMGISGGKYILHRGSERCGRFKHIAVA